MDHGTAMVSVDASGADVDPAKSIEFICEHRRANGRRRASGHHGAGIRATSALGPRPSNGLHEQLAAGIQVAPVLGRWDQDNPFLNAAGKSSTVDRRIQIPSKASRYSNEPSTAWNSLLIQNACADITMANDSDASAAEPRGKCPYAGSGGRVPRHVTHQDRRRARPGLRAGPVHFPRGSLHPTPRPRRGRPSEAQAAHFVQPAR